MRPFEGIRVIDLTHVFAGPFCTFQLAMLGADVIKVEGPDHPDMVRFEGGDAGLNAAGMGTSYQSQNAGKRAIALDLKSESGRAAMRRLIGIADVLVMNYAGEAAKQMGVDPAVTQAINPKLIHCTLTGYGRTGPKADHPAYDNVIQAYSGLMAGNGTPDTGPVRIGPAVVDYGTGAQAALAVSAALFQRERTGRGQVIDVAMVDAAMMLMAASVTDTIATGEPPARTGNINPNYAAYRTFDTAEGLLMVGAFTNAQHAALYDFLGEHARAAEVRAQTRNDLIARIAEDSLMLERHFLVRTADEWEKVLNAVHIPAARVRTVAEALQEPQVRSRMIMQSQEGDGDNLPELPVAAFGFAESGPSLDRPVAAHGQHTDEILKELGLRDADID
jgi:crotonobetainyl-CoA:carnitine CoA-transferase CaiB-like acyl-CoA transferase